MDTREEIPLLEISRDDHARQDLAHGVFYNDLIMFNVMKYIPNKQRTDFELSCKRAFELSRRTPCITGDPLQLIVEKQQNGRFCVIVCMNFPFAGPNRPDDNHIYERNYCDDKEKITDLLGLYLRWYRKDFSRLSMTMVNDLDVLKFMDKNLHNIDHFDCFTFRNITAEFLVAECPNMVKKIKRITPHLYEPSTDAKILAVFENLQEFGIFKTAENCQHIVLRTLNDIRESIDEHINPDLAQKQCRPDIKYNCCILFKRTILDQLTNYANLSKLTLDFHYARNTKVVYFFRALNIHKLTSANFYKLLYDDTILGLMSATENSNLIAFNLDSWERQDRSTFSLINILPPTLKHLHLTSALPNEELLAIAEKCPLLEYLHFFPYEIEEGIYKYGDFEKMVLKLENLKFFRTSMLLSPDFLAHILTTDLNLRSCIFKVAVVNDREFEETYMRLYGEKPIRYYHILDALQMDLDAEEDPPYIYNVKPILQLSNEVKRSLKSKEEFLAMLLSPAPRVEPSWFRLFRDYFNNVTNYILHCIF